MKHLLSILLICSIGFTQELTVDGNLNVTGNIQNQTIDSLLQVIQDLQSQLSALQGGFQTKLYEYPISFEENTLYDFNLFEITNGELDNDQEVILYVMSASDIFLENSNQVGIFIKKNYDIQNLTYAYNNGGEDENIPFITPGQHVTNEPNSNPKWWVTSGNVSAVVKILITAQFSSDSDVQQRKTGLQSKDKETVK